LTPDAARGDDNQMSVEKFLGAYVGNITTVIEWLFLGILCLVAAYLYRSLRHGAGDEASSSSQLAEIEKALKRVLDQVPGPRATEPTAVEGEDSAEPAAEGAAPAVSAEDAAVRAAELAQVRKERDEAQLKLAQAANQIAELKSAVVAAPAAGASGASSADAKVMESRVRELEGKLSDYEIIADDIANLSLYKSENARLKDELNRLKSGGAVAGTEATSDSSSAAPSASVDQSAIDAMLAAAQGNATPPAQDTSAAEKDASTRAALEALVEQVQAEKTQAPSASSDNDEISIASAMGDLQLPVEEVQAPAPVAPVAAAPAAPAAVVAAPVPAASGGLDASVAKSVETPSIGDDIMAEFAEAAEQVFKEAEAVAAPAAPAPVAAPAVPVAAAVAPTAAAPPPPVEVSAAPEVAPATPTPGAPTTSALDVKLDPDTIVNEMAEFATAAPPAKKSGDDATMLIEEFENFMKTS